MTNMPMPVHHFRPVSSTSELNHQHYVFEYGPTSGVGGWEDREWIMVPEVKDDGTWNFVIQPTDRQLYIVSDEKALREAGNGHANRPSWTVCGLDLGVDLFGPDYDKHGLRNLFWRLRGRYSVPCVHCDKAIEDVRESDW